MTAPAATPLRALERPLVEGCRVLNPQATGSDYRDGGEEGLFRLLQGASDLSSLSDELRLLADGWVQEYHLSPDRGNVVRAFSLQPDARVLEIGAGCGAVTRYLGERCAVVDALEPSLSRARVARERTRDLPGVEIVVGAVEDVPDEGAYDVVVVVGVLEHIAKGNPSDEPYAAFLQRLQRLLVDGGHLVLAIENKLGVKYLAGAPEDHTGRVYDGVEGYPRRSEAHARTFSRFELEALVRGAGLEPRTLGAMPDYKLPRAVFAHPLPAHVRSLEWRIPHFPSPDRGLTRPLLADERLLWRSLVQAELSQDTTNSFLILACKGGPATLLAEDTLAVFWNTQRRARYGTETVVRQTGEGVAIERTLLEPDGARDEGGLRLRAEPRAAYVEGQDLVDVLLAADDQDLHRWLQRWAALLAEALSSEDDVPLDLVPHNLLLSPDGRLVVIDDEWRGDGWSYTDVLARGVLRLADQLAAGTPAGRWAGLTTVRDVAVRLGALVGLTGDWLDSAVEREARLQVRVTLVDDSHEAWSRSVTRAQANQLAALAARLEDLPQGTRAFDRVPTLQAAAEVAEGELRVARDAVEAARCDVAALQNDLAALAEVQAERDRLVDQVGQLSKQLSHSTELLRREEKSVVRPLARRAYRVGRLLGGALSPATQEKIRAALAPVATAVAPRSAQAVAYQQARRAVSGRAVLPANSLPRPHNRASESYRLVPEPLPPGAPGAFDVIVMPVIDWHFRVQRPQHLSSHLAALGHRVLYLTTVFAELQPGQTPYTILESPADGVWIVRLACPQPLPRIYRDALAPAQAAAVADALRVLKKDLQLSRSVLVAHHPFWEPVLWASGQDLLVYDLIDDHAGFEGTERWVLDAEARLLEGVDLVTVTSSSLAEKAPGSVLVRNAAEVERFRIRPARVHKSTAPTVGYFGAIAHWFDTTLVERSAREHPDWRFVLIGSTFGADIAGLERLGNVELTGELPYDELPSYLHAFDVCLIPFHVIPLTEHTNPVKVYEYLSAGKPVVATAMPEVLLMQPHVHVGRTHDDFLRALDVAMAEVGDEALAQQRREWASQHTWDQRAEVMERAVEARYPSASVVVLCFNNLALTQACLESLDRATDYPDWELVLVDNASTDGTVEYLRDYAQGRSHVTLVLNDDNLGFAGGNNAGLRVATGDVLVMLNNDTVVTDGWLLALIRHLRDEPGLGLVGPVTNNIGNEAKVDVRYDALDALEPAARAYTSVRFRQRMHVPTVAFFCVAMRREVYEKVGGLDEDFGVGFFEDDDYCRRTRAAGYEVAIAEDVFVHHHLSASFDALGAARKQELFEKNKAIYEVKWGEWTPHTYRGART